MLVGADTNGHSRWWGPPDQASNATWELVEDFVITHSLEIENCWPAPATFSSDCGFEAWRDVTMTSSRLHRLVSSWLVMDTDLGLDQCGILGSIAICAWRGSEVDVRLDWWSVCWDSFCQALRARLQSILPKHSGIGRRGGSSATCPFFDGGTTNSHQPTCANEEDQLGLQLLVVQGAGIDSPRATLLPTEVEPDQGSS